MWLSKTGPTQTNFCATITKDYKKNFKKKKKKTENTLAVKLIKGIFYAKSTKTTECRHGM